MTQSQSGRCDTFILYSLSKINIVGNDILYYYITNKTYDENKQF